MSTYEEKENISIKYTKSDLNWLMDKTTQCSERYKEAENFIKSRKKYKF